MWACLCCLSLLQRSAVAAHRSLKAVPVLRSGNWIARLQPRPQEAGHQLLDVARRPLRELLERLPLDVVDAVDEAVISLLPRFRLCRGSRMNLSTESTPANPISAAWPRASGTSPIS